MRFRLVLIVVAVYLAVTLLSVVTISYQARTDVVREVESALSQTALMLEQLPPAQARIEKLRELAPRHVEIRPEGAMPLPQDVTHNTPLWFSHLIRLNAKPVPERIIQTAEGGLIRLIPDPRDEIDEVWDSIVQLAAIFAIACVLTLILLNVAIKHAKSQLRSLVRSLESEESPDFSLKLARYDEPEVKRLASHLTRIGSELEAEQADNQRLTDALMQLQEEERSALARELHDNLGQYITGVQATAALIEVCCSDPQKTLEAAQRIQRDCSEIHAGFRQLINSLHPVVLTELGLSEALRSLVQRWQESTSIICKLAVDDELPSLSIDSATHIYRLTQEALTNCARHSGANRVSVRLNASRKRLSLAIVDNGSGLPPGTRFGIGLRSIHQRARALGGTVRLESTLDKGLSLVIDLPCDGLLQNQLKSQLQSQRQENLSA